MWHYVREKLSRDGLDADELIRSLPRVGPPPGMGVSYGLAWYPSVGHIQDEEKPTLTVAAALHLPVLLPAMADPFLAVLRKLVEFHRGVRLEPDKVVRATYTAKRIRQELPGVSGNFMVRLPEILNHEPPTWGGSKWNEDGEWIRELSRDIYRYAGCTM